MTCTRPTHALATCLPVLLFASIGAASSAAPGTDPLTLQLNKDAYEVFEPITLTVTGTPGTPSVLFFDLDPGPTTVPGIGDLDIGFSPNFASIALPPLPLEGVLVLTKDGGVDCRLAGVPVFLQAVSLDVVTLKPCASNSLVLGIQDSSGICTGLACRLTGGGHDGSGDDSYTFGGQVGAPTASQPQPFGEWTHHQRKGPSGKFVFHAGTASAPDGTEIDLVTCSDPGACLPALDAPAKQIDFEGVGSFRNSKDLGPALAPFVDDGASLHRFEVHVEDLGEPGSKPAPASCPPGGSKGTLASCDCPDFYQLRIRATADPESPVIYEVFGYIDGGNLQIHEPIQ